MPTIPCPAHDASLGEWAQWYATLGWPVFPCHGKRPVTKRGLYDATIDTAQVVSWWAQWPTCNIGTPLGEARWALDVDARHNGLDTLHELERSYNQLPRTVTSLTGSGGGSMHLLWATGATPIHNKADLGQGLDVQGPGSYIILPPSIHPDTGQRYAWEADFGPDDLEPQAPPAWLEALVTQGAQPTASDACSSIDPDAMIVEGTRETTLMRLAGAMRRQGASETAIRAALAEENQRCTPPLGNDALDRMAHSVMRYPAAPVLEMPRVNGTQTPVGWSVNGVAGELITSGIGAQWRKELFSKKNGELTQNVFNITRILEHHDKWQEPSNLLWWDSVRGTPMCGQAEITDSLMMDIASWFGGAERLPITSPRLLEQCVIARCKKYPRDLLQMWLHALPPWDQKQRLTSWLTDIAGAPQKPYTADVSQVLIVSMVARALMPGCHYRYVVIFEGAEEIGKSSLVRELAGPEWYVELSIGLETKEAHMMLQGTWVAELAELDSLSRTEDTRLKAFITMREDSFIPKYSNFRQRTERRTIFIGTTNDESYLKGQSGNTRYLPLRLHHSIDLEHFRAIRPQLFAEALHYYYGHPETWWQLSTEALETAKEEREQRRVITVFEHPLHEWLETGRFASRILDEHNQLVTFTPGETSWPEIAQWYLKLDTPEKWKDRGLQMQIAAALRGLGWHVSQIWKSGRNTNIWRKSSEAS